MMGLLRVLALLLLFGVVIGEALNLKTISALCLPQSLTVRCLTTSAYKFDNQCTQFSAAVILRDIDEKLIILPVSHFAC